MQIQELLQKRKAKGYEIAKTKKVIQKNGKWLVPSQSNPNKTYEVVLLQLCEGTIHVLPFSLTFPDFAIS